MCKLYQHKILFELKTWVDEWGFILFYVEGGGGELYSSDM